MKFKLKVLDPKLPRSKISNDERWNTEVDIDIPERMILKLAEEITDELDSDQLYKTSRNKLLTNNEIEKLMLSSRIWKKIHIIISDLGYQTSRFTRLSLFQNLLDNKKIQLVIEEKITKIEQEKSAPKIPEEKIKDLPLKNTNVSTETVFEFVKNFSDN